MRYAPLLGLLGTLCLGACTQIPEKSPLIPGYYTQHQVWVTSPPAETIQIQKDGTSVPVATIQTGTWEKDGTWKPTNQVESGSYHGRMWTAD